MMYPEQEANSSTPPPEKLPSESISLTPITDDDVSPKLIPEEIHLAQTISDVDQVYSDVAINETVASETPPPIKINTKNSNVNFKSSQQITISEDWKPKPPKGKVSMKDLIGETLDVCKLESKLGQGGMGTVYLAQHLTLQKKVAIKILPPELASNEKILERFFREAQSAAKLEHPNIVQVHDVRSGDLGAFIVMQYVEGTTLTRKIIDGTLSLKEKISLLLQVSEGLLFAHKRGIIHRDIKSENILISNYGEAKIADFGLAKINDEFSSRLTAYGQIIGTPDYLPPEVCKGEAADNRSDQYSLGVVFYFTLTQRLPFKGANIPNLLMKHIHEEPIPPNSSNPEISRSLNYIVLKMMQKEPEKRYPTLEEMLHDLKWVSMGQELPEEVLKSIQRTHDTSDTITVQNPLLKEKKDHKIAPPSQDSSSITPAQEATKTPRSIPLKPNRSSITPLKGTPTQRTRTSSNQIQAKKGTPLPTNTARLKTTTTSAVRRVGHSSTSNPRYTGNTASKASSNNLIPILFVVGLLFLGVIVLFVLPNPKKNANNTTTKNTNEDTNPPVAMDKEKELARLVGETFLMLESEKNYKFKKQQYEVLLEKVSAISPTQTIRIQIALEKLKLTHEEDAKKLFEKTKKEADALVEQALRESLDTIAESKFKHAEELWNHFSDQYIDTSFWPLRQKELELILNARENRQPRRPFAGLALDLHFKLNGNMTGKLIPFEGQWRVEEGNILVGESKDMKNALALGLKQQYSNFRFSFEVKKEKGSLNVCFLAKEGEKHNHLHLPPLPLSPNQWHQISVEARDKLFKVVVNGTNYEVNAEEEGYSTLGEIIMTSQPHSLVYIRNIEIEEFQK